METDTAQKKKLLSTSSPEGLLVAARITPTRIANLLIRKGPLPIRHITGQLSLEVQGFEMLSLSKQRRLIMAAMEQIDPENNVLFEKIGWGQWAVRKVDSDYIVTEGTEGNLMLQQQIKDDEANNSNKKLLSVHDLRNQTGVKLGWTKKQQPIQAQPNQQQQQQQQVSPHLMSPPSTMNMHPPILPPISHRRKLLGGLGLLPGVAAALRRESISASKQNLHNIKLPNEQTDSASISTAIESDLEDDYALADEMDNSDSETDIESDEVITEGAMFSFDDDETAGSMNSSTISKFKQIPPIAGGRRRSSMKSPPPSVPIKFANRVPLKVSPPPGTPRATGDNGNIGGSTGRRKSSSSTPGVSKYSYNQRHQNLFNRSRLNSLENLDNYIVSSAKNSGTSLSSPPPPQLNSSAGPTSLSTLPWNSNYIHQAATDSIAATMSMGRRKSSFNESHIRSTLSSSLPKQPNGIVTTIVTTSSGSLHKPYENMSLSKSTNSVNNKTLARSGDHSDTDDEDWATIGAETLRRNPGLQRNNNNNNNSNKNNNSNGQLTSTSQTEERNAAYALVDLMSV